MARLLSVNVGLPRDVTWNGSVLSSTIGLSKGPVNTIA